MTTNVDIEMEMDFGCYVAGPTKADDLKETTEKAKELGLDVFVPDSRIITLDFDEISDYNEFLAGERFAFFQRFFTVVNFMVTQSKSGKGYHVYLTLDRGLGEPQRIAAQAILGSDWRRELFSLARNEKNPYDGNSIRMFEKPNSPVDGLKGLRKVA